MEWHQSLPMRGLGKATPEAAVALAKPLFAAYRIPKDSSQCPYSTNQFSAVLLLSLLLSGSV